MLLKEHLRNHSIFIEFAEDFINGQDKHYSSKKLKYKSCIAFRYGDTKCRL